MWRNIEAMHRKTNLSASMLKNAPIWQKAGFKSYTDYWFSRKNEITQLKCKHQ